MKRIFTVVMFLALISLISTATLAVPVEPHQFYGSVTVGGINAIVGTVIATSISDIATGSITVSTAGQYGGASTFSPKLTVTCPDSLNCRTETYTITFTVTNTGCSGLGTLTHTFTAGNIDNKYLQFTGTCVAGAAPGPGAAGVAGVGAAAAVAVETLITAPETIAAIKKSLPAEWVNIEIYQLGDPYSETVELTIALIDDALKLVTDEQAISELQLIKADLEANKVERVPLVVSLTKYKVLNIDTGMFVYRTIFSIIITAVKDMKDVKIVDVIPKSVAVKVTDITFLQTPSAILQEDPVVQWVIDRIAKGETKKIEYIVNRLLSRPFQKTIVVGVEAPPEEVEEEVVEEEEEIIPPVKPIPWVGIIIIAAVVVIGLIVYWRVSKKKV